MCFEGTCVTGLLVQKFEKFIKKYEQIIKLKKKHLEQKLLKKTNKHYTYFSVN